MKKSRILALLLCLCMLVGVLAACSKTDTTTPDASGDCAVRRYRQDRRCRYYPYVGRRPRRERPAGSL